MKVYLFSAFAYAKSFAIALIFFSSSPFPFHRKRESFFGNVSSFIIQEACDQDRTYFIRYTKKSLHRNCSLICYSPRVCHMRSHVLQLIHDNQHSQHPKKDKKQPETRKQIGRGNKSWDRIRKKKRCSKEEID